MAFGKRWHSGNEKVFEWLIKLIGSYFHALA